MPSANPICHFDGGRAARRNKCWSDASCAIEGVPGGFFSKNYLVLTRVESVGQAVLLAWISQTISVHRGRESEKAVVLQ